MGLPGMYQSDPETLFSGTVDALAASAVPWRAADS
jgi:hypothetical protein